MKALLDFRGITKDGLMVASKKLGKEVSDSALDKILKADDKIKAFKSVFGESAPAELARKSGKVGIIDKEIYYTDARYLRDADYKKKVDRLGHTPIYDKKLKAVSGTFINVNSDVDKLVKNAGSSLVKGLLKQGVEIDAVAMKKALDRIKKEGGDTERSVKQGVRFAVLAKAETDTRGKMCRILGTSADNPDFEHALLEGEIMPCEEAIKHLSRFGCQHELEVINE